MAMARYAAVLAFLGWSVPVFAARLPAAQPEGLWLSPHNNVAVRTGPCGERLCGWVVWADAEAQSDARDGGVARLVGTELLEDYHAEGRGNWSGTVFVPDMGRRFSSQINELPTGQLKIKGCILGGLICKSQVWTRIDHIPGG